MMLLVKDDGRSVAAAADDERVAASRFSVRVMRMANMVSFVVLFDDGDGWVYVSAFVLSYVSRHIFWIFQRLLSL